MPKLPSDNVYCSTWSPCLALWKKQVGLYTPRLYQRQAVSWLYQFHPILHYQNNPAYSENTESFGLPVSINLTSPYWEGIVFLLILKFFI